MVWLKQKRKNKLISQYSFYYQAKSKPCTHTHTHTHTHTYSNWAAAGVSWQNRAGRDFHWWLPVHIRVWVIIRAIFRKSCSNSPFILYTYFHYYVIFFCPWLICFSWSYFTNTWNYIFLCSILISAKGIYLSHRKTNKQAIHSMMYTADNGDRGVHKL